MTRLPLYLAAFVVGYVIGAIVEFLWLDHLFGGTGLRVEHRRTLDGGL